MKKLAAILSASAMFATAGVNAQWVINEIETETAGTNIQFVELYNPTPNASVAGLTLINIRSSQARAISAIDLTGSATGNYYLIGNPLYASSAAGLSQPAPDATLSADFRGQYHQTILVNTADLPGGFVAGGAGTVFAGTEFSSGALLLDSVQFTDGTDPVIWGPQTEVVIDNGGTAPVGSNFAGTDSLNPDSPFAAGRLPDGSTTWQYYPLNTVAGSISVYSTPGVANAASVSDWSMY
ncbi:hypothetical protein GC173_10705 [bacterium]|nr:hypothetical protein [bacterium]